MDSSNSVDSFSDDTGLDESIIFSPSSHNVNQESNDTLYDSDAASHASPNSIALPVSGEDDQEADIDIHNISHESGATETYPLGNSTHNGDNESTMSGSDDNSQQRNDTQHAGLPAEPVITFELDGGLADLADDDIAMDLEVGTSSIDNNMESIGSSDEEESTTNQDSSNHRYVSFANPSIIVPSSTVNSHSHVSIPSLESSFTSIRRRNRALGSNATSSTVTNLNNVSESATRDVVDYTISASRYALGNVGDSSSDSVANNDNSNLHSVDMAGSSNNFTFGQFIEHSIPQTASYVDPRGTPSTISNSNTLLQRLLRDSQDDQASDFPVLNYSSSNRHGDRSTTNTRRTSTPHDYPLFHHRPAPSLPPPSSHSFFPFLPPPTYRANALGPCRYLNLRPNIPVPSSSSSSLNMFDSVHSPPRDILESDDSDGSDVEFIGSSSPTFIEISESSDSDSDSDHDTVTHSSLASPQSEEKPSTNAIKIKSESNDSTALTKEEPQPSTSAAGAALDINDEEAQNCPICFEPWSNSGKHRLASLKCGHIYGQSCIEKWVKGRGQGKCPQCNATAHKRDIRVIYAKALKALDTSEQDRVLGKLKQEKEARKKAELETAQMKLRLDMAMQECQRMKLEIERQKQIDISTNASSSSTPQPSTSGVGLSSSGASSISNSSSSKFEFDRTIKFPENGGCRVMAYCDRLAQLIVSMPSPNSLYNGYGVKTINTLDLKTTKYIPCHSKLIRDISFDSFTHSTWMLTSSIDKKVKITDLHGACTVQSFQCDQPIWSCTWDTGNRNYFYVGQQNGVVCQFDIRNTEGAVQKLNTDFNRSPIVSLYYVPMTDSTTFRAEGLVVSQLTCVSFLRTIDHHTFRSHKLSGDNNLTYLSLDRESKHVLATYRPAGKDHHVKHKLFKLRTDLNYDSANLDQDFSFTMDHIDTKSGGSTQKLLSRSRLISHPGCPNKLLMCAGDEASNNLMIWPASTDTLGTQRLSTPSPILDICAFSSNQNQHLAALTEKSVLLYKWKY